MSKQPTEKREAEQPFVPRALVGVVRDLNRHLEDYLTALRSATERAQQTS